MSVHVMNFFFLKFKRLLGDYKTPYLLKKKFYALVLMDFHNPLTLASHLCIPQHHYYTRATMQQ